MEAAEGGGGGIAATTFERFDRDGSGLLDDNELSWATESLGMCLEERKVKDICARPWTGRRT